MTLQVHELITTLNQAIITPNRITNVIAVRLHLYKFASAPFTDEKLLLSIENESGIVAVSDSVLATQIPGEIFHGLIRFDINAQLQKNSAYRLVLKHLDYEFTQDKWLGWCTDFDFNTNACDYDYEQALLPAPKRYEIWAKAPRGY